VAIKPLSFHVVDGLGFAAATGKTDAAQAPYMPTDLGPLLEFLHLAAGGRLPEPPAGGSWLAKNSVTPMIAALKEQRELWLRPHDRQIGFIRALRHGSEGDSRMVSFLMDAQRAARDVARLPGTTPGQLVAAMVELETNIHEHSDASATGLLAFRAARGIFEFVAADRGIGILASLERCPLFAAIPDHGKALQSALTDGTSRFGVDSQHGHGFRPIFLGLTNLRGFLRFRSGDHALIIDGSSPSLAMAQLAQKPAIDGFFASISCRAPPNRRH
jgi:hypothetical protein